MKYFSTLLESYEGNPPVTGVFPLQIGKYLGVMELMV